MFHKHHLPKIHHSKLIALISVLENFAQAIMVVIIPLYIFALFQSELTLGNIAAAGTAAAVVTTSILGFILAKFPRYVLYKVAIGLTIVSVFLFFLISSLFEAYTARLLFSIGAVVTPAVLMLYLHDLTPPKEFSKMTGLFRSITNLAWVAGPILAGFLVNFFSNNQSSLVADFPFLLVLDQNYFEYIVPFIFSLLLYALALSIFAWNKFVVNNPHLAEIKSQEDNMHHPKHFQNLFEFFKHDKRFLSFINIAFIGIWWTLAFTYLSIFFSEHNISTSFIGIILGLLNFPLILAEPFIDKVIHVFKGSLNALIVGYAFFFIFLSLAFFIGIENIYLFSFFLIFAHLGVGITEPLQDLLYFEGTDKTNEAKFYSINQIGGQITRCITPLIMGLAILQFGINESFTFFPVLFLPLFLILGVFKWREK